MTELAQGLALVLAAFAAGWTAFFSLMIAPQAFRDLDQGRADRFVRNAMKGGHPVAAGVCAASGISAFMGGAPGGGAVIGLCAVMYVMAAWTLAPRSDTRPPPGGKRVLKTARIVASMITALIILVAFAAIGMIALGI
jgi:hypothetical protein